MKKDERKIRKTLAALLAVILAAGLLSAAVSAEVLPDNPAGTTVDRIASGDFMQGNSGTVGSDVTPAEGSNQGPPDTGNFGTIAVNEGTGMVRFNQRSGSIGTRDEEGKIVDPENEGNFGIVITNGGGTVTVNHPGALVSDNHGSVMVNEGRINGNFGRVNRNEDTVERNGRQIFDDGRQNVGTIRENYGFVIENEGVVSFNAKGAENSPATVAINKEAGVVEKNAGEIYTNDGTVGVETTPDESGQSGPPDMGNFGRILVNGEKGTVLFNQRDGVIGGFDENGQPVSDQGNYGTVRINGSGTITVNQEGGVVADNHGKIIVNNGTVEANYRNIEENSGTVTLNGHQVFEDGENLGVIRENNQTVVTNQGRIVDNKGDVTVNEGLIHTNNGKVSQNIIKTFTFLDNGQKVTAPGVEVNNGTIESSTGSVATNRGFIGALDENGMMESGNAGMIRVNEATGIVLNLAGGIVYTNNGTVYNYGGTIEKSGTGTEFFSVEIVNSTQNTSVRTSGLQEAYGRQWLGQTGTATSTATIRLVPKSGYEITAVTGLADNVRAEKNIDGSWTLTVTSGKNTKIDVPESTEKAETPDMTEEPSIPGESGNGISNVNNWYEYAETLPRYNGIPDTPAAAFVPNSPSAAYAPVYTETVIAVTAADTAGNVETVAYTIETAPPAPQTAEAAVTVSATESGTEAVISRDVEEVLTQGTENAAFEDAVNPESEAYNEEFAAAAQSALTISAGTVDFGDAFANAEEATVEVPVTVAGAEAGQEYTVVLSNGDTITVACEKDGELVIPFPKDAENLSFVIQSDYASRYAKLIENYLLYGEEALAGRSAKTQEFVRAYAEELKRNS